MDARDLPLLEEDVQLRCRACGATFDARTTPRGSVVALQLLASRCPRCLRSTQHLREALEETATALAYALAEFGLDAMTVEPIKRESNARFPLPPGCILIHAQAAAAPGGTSPRSATPPSS